MKGNKNLVSAPAADRALELAGGDRSAAYGEYIRLFFAQTGKLDPGCDNQDLQAYYDDGEGEDDNG